MKVVHEGQRGIKITRDYYDLITSGTTYSETQYTIEGEYIHILAEDSMCILTLVIKDSKLYDPSTDTEVGEFI